MVSISIPSMVPVGKGGVYLLHVYPLHGARGMCDVYLLHIYPLHGACGGMCDVYLYPLHGARGEGWGYISSITCPSVSILSMVPVGKKGRMSLKERMR